MVQSEDLNKEKTQAAISQPVSSEKADSPDMHKEDRNARAQKIEELLTVSEEKMPGFEMNEELRSILKGLGKLQSGERKEFTLPANIDVRFFISELGRTKNNYEFAGLYSPSTRSTLVMKNAEQRGFIESASAEFLAPRETKGKEIDDIFFHTHLENCFPSSGTDGGDMSTILMVKQEEEEQGLNRKVVSIIGADGKISVTECEKMGIDEQVLRDNNFTDEQVKRVKILLALEPPIWLTNHAKDEDSAARLLEATRELYKKRKNRKSAYNQMLTEFIESVKPLLKDEENGARSLYRNLFTHLPKFPGRGWPGSIGLNRQQAELLQSMLAKVSVYKVEEGKGLEKLPFRQESL